MTAGRAFSRGDVEIAIHITVELVRLAQAVGVHRTVVGTVRDTVSIGVRCKSGGCEKHCAGNDEY